MGSLGEGLGQDGSSSLDGGGCPAWSLMLGFRPRPGGHGREWAPDLEREDYLGARSAASLLGLCRRELGCQRASPASLPTSSQGKAEASMGNGVGVGPAWSSSFVPESPTPKALVCVATLAEGLWRVW